MTIDWALITSVVGTGGAIFSAFAAASRYTSNLKLQLQSLKHENELQNLRLDAALQLIDKRQRDLERYLEKQSGFTPQHKRHEETGAPWLKD